jgi:tetratricopeptide (TPR) repeat protein
MASAYILRAVSNFYLENFDDITSDIEISLQMDPYILADLYYFQVRKTIDKAIEIAPENVNLYYGRGYANFINGYYRLAVNDFAKALELVPGNAEFYKYSGASKTWIKDIPGAKADLNLAMGINPDDPEIYYYLGVLANDVENQPSMGYEYFSTAIELDPYDPDYLYERAWCLYKLTDYEFAMEDLKQAIELNDMKGDYYVLRGYLALYGDVNTGYEYCDDFRKAEELGTIYKLKNLIRKNCK